MYVCMSLFVCMMCVYVFEDNRETDIINVCMYVCRNEIEYYPHAGGSWSGGEVGSVGLRSVRGVGPVRRSVHLQRAGRSHNVCQDD